MALYTVSLFQSGVGSVSIGDGTLLASLSVAAGRGPKGDGFTGGTYNASTGVVTFTSNDGLGFATGDLRGDLNNVDINGGSIDGTVIGGTTPAAGSFTNISATGTIDGRDVAADGSKLDGIEAGADVTDTANVTAAGALMDSELTDITAVKALDQGVATTDDPTFTNTQLAAIAESKAVTAVDVFVYDTSKDSDGGAWRKRTQGTIWYNETLNTATRGSRREFPAVAVIVAESNKVTIYDGDDPSLPMWIVEGYTGLTLNAVAMANGQASIATTVGLILSDYVGDNLGSVTPNYTSSTSPGIVDNTVNDVAMTVLPDAPIDPATGLPVPTIAVATAGGVSVIKDDGTVVDNTYSNATEGLTSHIRFTDDGGLIFNFSSSTGANNYIYVFDTLPTADNVITVNTKTGSSQNADALYTTRLSKIASADLALLAGVNNATAKLYALTTSEAGTALGLSNFYTDSTAPANSMVAYTTSTYNTGWMNGDIKGAFLSHTDDTDLVGGVELVTNGTFDSDTDWTKGTGWTIGSGVATAVGAGGYLVQTNVLGNGVSKVIKVSWDQTITSGTRFRFFARNDTDSSSAIILSGSATGGATYGSGNCNGSGTFTVYVQTTDGFTFKLLAESGNDGTIDNVSVTEADADRSVNNKPLNINGTITRSPVATGADLVAYSGFSASNYLEGNDTSYVDTLYAIGWEQTSGVWGFKHGVVSTAPIDGLTITTNTLKIQGTKPKALIRLSATTPSAAQLEKIENDEKVLFQENAQATLYGTSDAVTALAHDDATNLLHVGTSAGRSVFQGLRRVENTTAAVGTAISASNGLVVEE